ncbi:TonB-dependent receptor [Brevundimonas sp.]|uniref:TonB-dependent receptor domain-containing protein n=1 Tax=Brevundimonas sp. TaxID=1871086 RepID=UPI0025F669C8|nr:TonB-dependent receptor [Brevundimonas sp.]
MSIRKRALLGATALAGLTLTIAPASALAQTAETDPTASETAEPDTTAVDEIVIVGSRIRRDTYNSPSPVQVITAEETLQAGYASTTEALQGTAVTGGSSQINNAFGGYVTEGGPGANTIGLRGLGPSRTLVLLNGRRVAPAGSRGSVGSADLNVLPTAMIERIEVLRDGASSVYGSDAIAGVVNIITRRNVDDVTLSAQYNYAGGAGDTYRVSAVGGVSGDRWSLSGSAEYYERNELTLGDRDWTRCNTDYRINRARGVRNDDVDPVTGLPVCYPITSTGSNGVTINTIGTGYLTSVPGEPGTTYRPGVVGAPGAERGAYFNRYRPNPNVTTGLVGFEGVGGYNDDFSGISLNVRDTFEERMLNESLISPAQITTGYLQGSYDVQALGNAEAFFEVLGNNRRSQQTGYRQLALDYAVGSPLIPSELAWSRFAPDQGLNQGQDVGVRAFIGYGNDVSEQEVTFWKGTTGLRGDFFIPAWRYEATLSHSRSNSDYTFQSFLTDRLINSLDVVSAPAGTDPALVRGGFTCASNVSGATANCIPAPFLNAATIGGDLPADWRNYVFVPVTGTTQYEETVASAFIDGPLFDLPAGEVMGVFGVEYRTASIDDQPPADSVSGNLYNLTSAAPTVGSDSVWEAYGEVELPILVDAPFARELTANLSARYTDYESYGADITYKVGLVYTPTDWLSFRTSYGTSFRAPALFEQFQGGTTGFLSSTVDPCDEYGQGDPTTIRYANCQAEIGDPRFRQTSGVEVITAGGADAGLEAETSTNFSAGVIFQPTLPESIGQLAIAVDYYDIEVNNGVTRVGGSAILQRCYDDPEFRAGGGFCRLVDERNPADGSLTVRDSYTNVATDRVNGIDYNVRFTRDVGPGLLTLNGSVTQYLEQTTQLFADDPEENLTGTLTYPEFTGTADASFAWDTWRVRYGVEWVGEQDSTEYLGLDPADPDLDYVFDVDDYFIHNASVQYQANDWTITAGLRNLFDATPPSISSGAYNRVGNAPLYSGYDYLGRTAFINLSRTF